MKAPGGESRDLSSARFGWPRIASLVLLGVAVRLFFFFFSPIDADEAIVGLMAKHIQEGRGIPLFYYGQSYMGSLEPVFVALSFSLLGRSVSALKAVPLIFSALLVWFLYLLACRYVSRAGALVAAGLAAFPPAALMEWGLKARGGFIELVVLEVLALILATDLLRGEKLRSRRLLLLGLVLGVAWWTNNQAIFFLVPIGGVLTWHLCSREGFRRALPLGGILSMGFLVGSAPFWYHNVWIQPRWSTFAAIGGQASWAEMAQHAAGFFRESLPILFGARRFWSTGDVFPGATLCAYLIYGLAVIGAFVPLRRERVLVLLVLLFTPLVFVKSSFGWLTQAPRYLLPLYPLLFLALGMTFDRLRRCTARAVFLAGLIALHGISNFLGGAAALPAQPLVFAGERVQEDQRVLYRWLEAEGHAFVRTNYWIGYRMAFETDEKVRFSRIGEPESIRVPTYEMEARQFGDLLPYVLLPGEARYVEPTLAARGFAFRSTPVGGYVVLDRIVPRLEVGSPVSPAAVTVSSRQEWAPNLVDGNLGTRWGSGEPRRPGMEVRIHLERPTAVNGVDIQMGFWLQDSAELITLFGRREDGSECVIYRGQIIDRWRPSERGIRLVFPPVRAVALRIVQEGSHPVFDWSLAEVTVFRGGSDGI